jgi:hypothetical protein
VVELYQTASGLAFLNHITIHPFFRCSKWPGIPLDSRLLMYSIPFKSLTCSSDFTNLSFVCALEANYLSNLLEAILVDSVNVCAQGAYNSSGCHELWIFIVVWKVSIYLSHNVGHSSFIISDRHSHDDW